MEILISSLMFFETEICQKTYVCGGAVFPEIDPTVNFFGGRLLGKWP
jgi:hypothetical protein